MPQHMTYGEALIAALDEVMEHDQRVVLFNPSFIGMATGQDKLTATLRQKYAKRISSRHRRARFLRHRHRRRDGRLAAGGRPQHRHVFLRSDSADRQRSGDCLCKFRRANHRAGGFM